MKDFFSEGVFGVVLCRYFRKRRGKLCRYLRKTRGCSVDISGRAPENALYLSQKTRKAGTKEKLFSYLSGRSVSYILISGKGKSESSVGISGRRTG